VIFEQRPKDEEKLKITIMQTFEGSGKTLRCLVNFLRTRRALYLRTMRGDW
jgi:hypothetical protein